MSFFATMSWIPECKRNNLVEQALGSFVAKDLVTLIQQYAQIHITRAVLFSEGEHLSYDSRSSQVYSFMTAASNRIQFQNREPQNLPLFQSMSQQLTGSGKYVVKACSSFGEVVLVEVIEPFPDTFRFWFFSFQGEITKSVTLSSPSGDLQACCVGRDAILLVTKSNNQSYFHQFSKSNGSYLSSRNAGKLHPFELTFQDLADDAFLFITERTQNWERQRLYNWQTQGFTKTLRLEADYQIVGDYILELHNSRFRWTKLNEYGRWKAIPPFGFRPSCFLWHDQTLYIVDSQSKQQ